MIVDVRYKLNRLRKPVKGPTRDLARRDTRGSSRFGANERPLYQSLVRQRTIRLPPGTAVVLDAKSACTTYV